MRPIAPSRTALVILCLSWIAGQEPAFAAERAPGESLIALLLGGETMEFVWIPPGRFTMGTTSQERERLEQLGWWGGNFHNEQPAHEREVNEGFYLGKFEITQRQWIGVMRTAPWQGYIATQPTSPAVCLSWDVVQLFVQRLNNAMGDSLYRLPTEVEWEYACRAGTQTPWFFGADPDSLDSYAWFYENARSKGTQAPLPVGLKRPNPWGLFDIYGNAWEWCADKVVPYVPTDFAGPLLPLNMDLRIMRGGCFDSSIYIRSALRGASVPSTGYNIFLGARIVRRAR
jgi:formylglycine-generating enzyme required for sulfatase activity